MRNAYDSKRFAAARCGSFRQSETRDETRRAVMPEFGRNLGDHMPAAGNPVRTSSGCLSSAVLVGADRAKPGFGPDREHRLRRSLSNRLLAPMPAIHGSHAAGTTELRDRREFRTPRGFGCAFLIVGTRTCSNASGATEATTNRGGQPEPCRSRHPRRAAEKLSTGAYAPGQQAPVP